MSRRRDRQRRRDRKAREYHRPDPGLPDMTKASAHWRATAATLAGRGFTSPPFAGLTWGPIVDVELQGDPPEQASANTIAELVRRTREQRES
jgi:hypothetical protein